jgi:hypothetical protein
VPKELLVPLVCEGLLTRHRLRSCVIQDSCKMHKTEERNDGQKESIEEECGPVNSCISTGRGEIGIGVEIPNRIDVLSTVTVKNVMRVAETPDITLGTNFDSCRSHQVKQIFLLLQSTKQQATSPILQLLAYRQRCDFVRITH